MPTACRRRRSPHGRWRLVRRKAPWSSNGQNKILATNGLCLTIRNMSDMRILGKSRTVRLPVRIDARLKAKAADTGKSVSALIRQTVEAEYSQDIGTAGEWVLKQAQRGVTRRHTQSQSKAFQEAYRKRHW